MPRVHHRKSRKDYPDAGIKKGDMYYTWSLKTGPRSSRTFRQKTPPMPEQLTTSEYLQEAYPLERSIHDCTDGSELDDLVSQVEQLRDTTQEKLDNMPEGLQQGDTGNTLQERIDNCEAALTVIEQVKGDFEEWEANEAEDKDDFDWSPLGEVSLT